MGVKHSITHPARARVCWAVCSTAKSIYSFIPSKFFKASSRHVLLFKMLQKSKHLKIHGRSDLLTPINFHFPFLLIGAWRRISIPAPGRQTLQGAASGPQLRKPRRNAALCTRRALHGANRARLEELDQTLPSLAQLSGGRLKGWHRLLQSLGEAKLCVHVFVCRQSSGAGPRTQWHSHARRAGRAGRAHTPGGAVQVSAINLMIQLPSIRMVQHHWDNDSFAITELTKGILRMLGTNITKTAG